jgi:hypothetical protein
MVKSYDSFILDVENKTFMQKNYLGRKSALVNTIITQIRTQKEENPEKKTITLQLQL